MPNLQLCRKDSLHPLLHGIKVLASGNVITLALLSTCQSEILGHDALLVDDVHASLLQTLGELDNLGGTVELATLGQTTGPGKDGSDGVGRGRVALLVLAVMAGNSTVSGLGLEGLSVGGDEDRSHQTQRTEALGYNVGLDITVVVLEGHDVAALALDHLSNHVVDETVLVPDACRLELALVLLLVNLLEDVLEPAVVLLEDCVLGAHVQRQLLADGELERGMCEAGNGFFRVVLRLRNTADVMLFKVEDFNLFGLSALGSEDHLQLALTLDDEVLGSVLVAECVTADDDGLFPAWHETGDARNYDWLTEDGTAAGMVLEVFGKVWRVNAQLTEHF